MGMAWKLHREWGIPAEALITPPACAGAERLSLKEPPAPDPSPPLASLAWGGENRRAFELLARVRDEIRTR